MILLHIIQLMILVDAGLVVPDACSTTKVVCVGEGQPCLYDQSSPSNICNNPLISHCRVCANEGLRCYSGSCIRLLRGEGSSCSTSSSSRSGCRLGLTCSSSRCIDTKAIKPTPSFSRGEMCEPLDDKCIATLQCDINRRCAWPFCTTSAGFRCSEGYDQTTCEMMTESGQQCIWRGIDTNFVMDNSVSTYSCSNEFNCLFGDYCAPPSVGTTRRTCLSGVRYGGRLGATCRSEDAIGHEQCGEGMECRKKNPFEATSHVDYNVLTCQWRVGPFDGSEGERCVDHDDCGKNMLCSYNVCISSDTTHLGEGCADDSECGRGLTCSCPRMGDDTGRKRCVEGASFQVHNKNVDDFNKIYKPMVQCYVANSCRTEFCKRTKCKANFEAWLMKDQTSKLCHASIGLDTYIKEAAYEGVPVVGGKRILTYEDMGWRAAALTFLCLLIICMCGFIVKKIRPGSNNAGGAEAVGMTSSPH